MTVMIRFALLAGLVVISLAGEGLLGSGLNAQQNTPRIPDRNPESVRSESPIKQNIPRVPDRDSEIIRDLNKRIPPEPSAEGKSPRETADPSPANKNPIVLMPEQAKVYRELDLEERRAQHGFYQFTIHSAQRTFDFHYWSSIVIFFMVLGIVWMGVTLTWKQVTREMEDRAQAPVKKKTEKDSDLTEGPGPETQHQVEIGPKGLKIQSDVVGLMILAVSLGFFYLYLRYVYPISFVQ